MKRPFWPLFLLLPSLALAQQDNQIEYLHSFARLYGYVKYFHPSDEASDIDWSQFAIYGAEQVVNCRNSEELEETLNDLFLPIAPSMKLHAAKEDYRVDMQQFKPESLEGFELISWQHQGLGLGNTRGPYKSIRLNRGASIKEAVSEFGTITTSLEAKKYQGKAFILEGSVKILEEGGTGHLWARVDREARNVGFFDNMGDRPIQSDQWEKYTIEGNIDEDGIRLFFGCFLRGEGALLIDDVSLKVKDGNNWKVLFTSDFEQDPLNEYPVSFSKTGTKQRQGYQFQTVTTESGIAVEIRRKMEEKGKGGESLFENNVRFGEVIDKEIGSGLSCIIPLSLYGNSSYTYPKGDEKKGLQLKEKLEKIKVSQVTGDQLATRLGTLVICWNVFQHFYPYFEVVEVNWKQALDDAFKKAFKDKNAYEFHQTLELLTAQLKDGHVRVNSKYKSTNSYFPPIEWEWVEDQLIITKVHKTGLGVKVGDIILQIDDKSPKGYFEEIEQYISAATKGWKDYRAKTEALAGQKDKPLVVNVQNPKGQTSILALKREMDLQTYFQLLRETGKKESTKELANNIFYINIGSASMMQIKSILPQLKEAKGIICDLRGYPNGNHELITHLLSKPDTSRQWMQVPLIIYPDQENIPAYRHFGWELPTEKPHIDPEKVVFLIDGRAISYAESYMGFIEHYDLATIIGQPTAGTNGNVNPFRLPGGYGISWTGMKVLKHDGSQHHGVGIIPDIYMEKSIKGVREDRDEYLDKAIEVLSK